MKKQVLLPDEIFGKLAKKTAAGSTRRNFIARFAGLGLFLLAPIETTFGQEGGCTPNPDDSCDGCCGSVIHYNRCSQWCCSNQTGVSSWYYFACGVLQKCCGFSCIPRQQLIWTPSSSSNQLYDVQCCSYNCQTCGSPGNTYPCNCQGAGYVYAPPVSNQGCCGDGIYNTCTQGCCDGKKIYNLATQCCCGVGDGHVEPCTGQNAC